MAFTVGERELIRYYLGRASRNEDSREWPLMRIDDAILDLTPEAEQRVRGLLGSLQKMEAKMLAAVDCANVTAAGTAQFDPGRALRLAQTMGQRLCRNLADWLGVCLYSTPFDPAFRAGTPTLRG